MSIRRRITSRVGSRVVTSLAPKAGSLSPGKSSAVIHQALERAINGFGPLSGAATSAESHLSPADVEALHAGRLDPAARHRAVKELVSSHTKLAATQGFITNLGGLAAMPATVPANVAGLAVVQLHLVAGIAHLGGHDLRSPAVRDAVLVCLLGKESVRDLVAADTLPGSPRALAADPGTGGARTSLDRLIAGEITKHLLARITGGRVATTVGRRVPVLGGAVGAGSDARSTRAVAAYAAQELTG